MEGSSKKLYFGDTYDLIKELFDVITRDDYPTFVELLEQKPIGIVMYDNDLIRHAALWGALRITKYLLNKPEIDPNCNGLQPINNAIYNGHDKIVKLFLNCDRVKLINENPRHPIIHKTVLEMVLGQGKLSTLKLLLEHPRFDCKTAKIAYSPSVFGLTDGEYSHRQWFRVREMEKYLFGHGIWTRTERQPPAPEMTFDHKDWTYFPHKRRRVYLEFLCCLRYLGYHKYMRDLHDTVMPYYFKN